MGRYITCQYCGKQEKGYHPSCGCLEKESKKLENKLVGSTIIETQVENGDILMKMQKNDETFYVRTCLYRHSFDDMEGPQPFYEVDDTGYDRVKNKMKVYEFDIKEKFEPPHPYKYLILETGYTSRINIDDLRKNVKGVVFVYDNYQDESDEFVKKFIDDGYSYGCIITKYDESDGLHKELLRQDYCAFFGNVYKHGYYQEKDVCAYFEKHDTESG